MGIESSCDETAASVVEDGTKILSNVIASQISIHTKFGGVVPEVASRAHLEAVSPVIKQAMSDANADWKDITAVAVSYGPGLAGSLLVGVSAAKAVAFSAGLPLVGINHMEGHIYANWLSGEIPDFPLICLTVSGGHTDLMLMTGHGKYKMLGSTRDDAVGEAFDKVARLLDLGYPGGPAIDREAQKGKPIIDLPQAVLSEPYDFSFSGVKTHIYRMCEKDLPASVPDICASFQCSVVDTLVKKTVMAARQYNTKTIILSGGVAANSTLRETIVSESPVRVVMPPRGLCTDNAAMVASAGYFRFKSGDISSMDLDVMPNLKLCC